MATREQNERQYKRWLDLPDGGRQYWLDVQGRKEWRARYVKIVDQSERTVQSFQEIYDASGKLVSMHVKYPEDRRHQLVLGYQVRVTAVAV
jgi:hypothetical protein